MEIYLDNSSTTQPNKEVIKEILFQLENNYGNPSSVHKKGIDSERIIKKSREELALTLQVKPKEIFFTSGGTESNNIALLGAIEANKKSGKHIISSEIEHDSIYNTLKYISQKNDIDITFLKPNFEGIISSKQVENALREDTILVSIMHVNNELGSINSINEIGKKIKEYNSKIIFHVDAIQSYMKMNFDCKYIDLLSISGHKIHTPKGIGALYINDEIKHNPTIYGGGQEMGKRSGTENTAYIAGLMKAIQIQKNNILNDYDKVTKLKNIFLDKLSNEISNIKINSPEKSLPYIVNISFIGVKGEILLHTLEQSNIYVSTGSACSSKKKSSRILESIGLNLKEKDSAIRFSFSKNTTIEEINIAIEIIQSEVKQLRKFLNK